MKRIGNFFARRNGCRFFTILLVVMITACGGGGGDDGGEIIAPPPVDPLAPRNARAEMTFPGTIVVSWDSVNPDNLEFNVYCSTTSATTGFWLCASAGVTERSIKLWYNLIPNQMYWFYVQERFGERKSNICSTSTAGPPSPKPVIYPEIFRLENGNWDVTLHWSYPPGETFQGIIMEASSFLTWRGLTPPTPVGETIKIHSWGHIFPPTVDEQIRICLLRERDFETPNRACSDYFHLVLNP